MENRSRNFMDLCKSTRFKAESDSHIDGFMENIASSIGISLDCLYSSRFRRLRFVGGSASWP